MSSRPVAGRPCGDRTHDQQIKSPLAGELAALRKASGNVVPVLPRPRKAPSAADVQQAAKVRGKKEGR
jgi:hypothetical protein